MPYYERIVVYSAGFPVNEMDNPTTFSVYRSFTL
jgi:hypothetical protein